MPRENLDAHTNDKNCQRQVINNYDGGAMQSQANEKSNDGHAIFLAMYESSLIVVISNI